MISFGISLSNYEQFYDSIGKWFPVVFPGIAETVCMLSQKPRVLEVTFTLSLQARLFFCLFTPA